jgi:hypothetical protein
MEVGMEDKDYGKCKEQLKKEAQDLLNLFAPVIKGFTAFEIGSKKGHFYSSLVKDKDGNVFLRSQRENEALLDELVSSLCKISEVPNVHTVLYNVHTVLYTVIQSPTNPEETVRREVRCIDVQVVLGKNGFHLVYSVLPKEFASVLTMMMFPNNNEIKVCDDLGEDDTID